MTRTRFIGVDYDPLTLDDLLDQFGQRPAEARFAYLVTPNVDHVVRLHDPMPDGDAVWAAYRGAEWCVCDSRILAALARRQGITLPVAPGSDLTAMILERLCRPGDRVAIIGGRAETAERLRTRYPTLDIVHHAPPMGLRRNAAALEAAAQFAAGTRARFLFLSVGSPQQELLAARIAAQPGATGIGLCVGAAIEFVVGEQTRAPELVQRLHLEWAHRLLGNPRRMWRRYLVEGPRIFLLARRHRSRG